ncbi:formate dehydrogenase accessory sulfurtransferase FdhD [Haliangium ochraceum]|uniref:Sulfur carrier protein FdhD n=1 Tax=Haliangium ochraceum (strain DSM 14365 / JCM 11303 / SMP-2) TaxID=502025 RepID=D0LGG0_HALO1|nr:formate dehydrogenase accessory sulfurtransferase FdhD [Haliangium ochraceum]ACY12706.1 formate dehydrogenase family accessory protein FdhD [Haliangium ochraceum DSM 14365]
MRDGSATCQRRVQRIAVDGARETLRDAIAVEEPLELRTQGRPLVVVMRTPGHDRELARGLLFGEGLIARQERLPQLAAPADLRPEERGNVLETGLPASSGDAPRWLAASACGVCGKRALADLALRAQPLRTSLAVAVALIASLPERLRAAQEVFARTGGLHAAGLFDTAGALLVAREDIGRHNAVDKVIGWALETAQDGDEGDEGGGFFAGVLLCVSGRVGYEIVQKAIVAGIAIIVAVSAPSSLAIDLAERFRVTLCGFTRAGRFNVYSHLSRIAD